MLLLLLLLLLPANMASTTAGKETNWNVLLLMIPLFLRLSAFYFYFFHCFFCALADGCWVDCWSYHQSQSFNCLNWTWADQEHSAHSSVHSVPMTAAVNTRERDKREESFGLLLSFVCSCFLSLSLLAKHSWLAQSTNSLLVFSQSSWSARSARTTVPHSRCRFCFSRALHCAPVPLFFLSFFT